MSQDTLQRIVEDVKTLTPQEQQQLRALLDNGLTQSHEETVAQQQMLLERLLHKGVIADIPPGLYKAEAGDLHAPIQVKGRPVSEALLEDRA